ncbi:MAG: hypothetical protein HY007_02350 [Candidatus Sungbacteria bacterium]|nr:hypothetical protein [Candidatus Sungbacteria bacterium]
MEMLLLLASSFTFGYALYELDAWHNFLRVAYFCITQYSWWTAGVVIVLVALSFTETVNRRAFHWFYGMYADNNTRLGTWWFIVALWLVALVVFIVQATLAMNDDSSPWFSGGIILESIALWAIFTGLAMFDVPVAFSDEFKGKIEAWRAHRARVAAAGPNAAVATPQGLSDRIVRQTVWVNAAIAIIADLVLERYF